MLELGLPAGLRARLARTTRRGCTDSVRALVYPPQPVYRVEQGPIHNVVVVPYEPAPVRFDYLPPRFFADCACDR